MKFKYLKNYISVFVLGVLLIAVYKTFDNFSVILQFFKTLFSTLTPFFIGFAIALLFYPPCVKIETWLMQRKQPFLRRRRRGLAVLLVFFMFIVIIAVIFYLLLPALTKSIMDFVAQVPNLLKELMDYINATGLIEINVDKFLSGLTPEAIWQYIDGMNLDKYAAGVAGFSTAFFNFFMAIIISVYVLLDRKQLKDGVLRITNVFVKEKTRNVVSKYVKRSGAFIYKYVYCQIIDALIIFVLSFIILASLRVKYYHLFALMLGVFNLVPYFGAITACVITTLITIFTADLTKGIWVAVLLIILQQVDANIIQPRLVNSSFSIQPFWVIFGVLVGGGLFGILGILLAIPFMALFNSMLDDYIQWKKHEKTEACSNDV